MLALRTESEHTDMLVSERHETAGVFSIILYRTSLDFGIFVGRGSFLKMYPG